jgi:hypothetical protein
MTHWLIGSNIDILASRTTLRRTQPAAKHFVYLFIALIVLFQVFLFVFIMAESGQETIYSSFARNRVKSKSRV